MFENLSVVQFSFFFAYLPLCHSSERNLLSPCAPEHKMHYFYTSCHKSDKLKKTCAVLRRFILDTGEYICSSPNTDRNS